MGGVEEYLPEIAVESVKEANNLVTQDLLALSFKDRAAIDEEIHGARNCAVKETPEIVQAALRDLSTELGDIPSKDAFDKSQTLFPNHNYVKTVEFRLMFLRCEFFDAKKAAIRMVAYLDLLHELYNEDEVLRRPIQLSDLSKAEVKILRLGYFQLLPYRDRSGRPVFADVGEMGFHLDLKPRLRIILYIFSVASQDVESQRKGMVHVAWPEGDFSNIPMPLHNESRRLLKKLFAGMPIRIASIHLCFPDTLYFQLLRSFLLLSIVKERSRVKIHLANGVERRYGIKSFGIPAEMIPVTESGNIKKINLYQWIKVQKLIESKTSSGGNHNDSIIFLPGSNDVLIRSGTTTASHPGNALFRSLIEMKHKEFRSGSDMTQAILAEDIVEAIESLNGRFLIWDKIGYWTELKDRHLIIFKVEVAIRDFRVKIRANETRQKIDSSTHRFVGQDGTGTKRRKRSSSVNCTENSGLADMESERCSLAC